MRLRALTDHPSFRRGLRDGVPVAIAGVAVAVSFGVLARPVLGTAGAIVMSAIVFAGSAQFGSVAVLAAGGGPLAAIAAGILLNLRYVPMGVALAPSLRGGLGLQAIKAQAMVDYSWAAAMRGGGSFDVRYMVGLTVPMYIGWISGTAAGAFAGELLGDPEAIGLDAVFPAFFLALLMGTDAGRTLKATLAAGAAGLIALALIPVAPPGVPIIAACIAALIGFERRRPERPTDGRLDEVEAPAAAIREPG
ncbi:MAG TPA: AzlC family ABC transporter permease [Solirubrobacterales bacterium]|nr:AzlC family ABC transporter permease [Solirubrobacterales bacterium]